MKTDIRTGGFGGGITDARTVRPRCRATAVLPRDCGSCYRVVAAKKDARPVLQHRTGASNGAYQMTIDSIARMPRYQRWGLYAFAALGMTGKAPMALAALLTWLCDLVGWWLLIPLYVVVGRVLWRVIWS